MIRLVALDLDGTVFQSDKSISARTLRAIRAAIDSGILVMPATGRPSRGLPADFLNLPGVDYAIVSNGAAVYDLKEKKSIQRAELSPEKVLSLFPTLLSYDCTLDLYMEGHAYTDERSMREIDRLVPNPVIREYVRNTRTVVPDLYQFALKYRPSVEKINLSFPSEAERRELWYLLSEDSELLISSGLQNTIEINDRSADKGSAILRFASSMGIRREETMAIGDSTNDLMMLQKVGTAVAMGNALPEVKALADILTTNNDEDGVALVLEGLVGRQEDDE